jgi:hypothetical protein
VNLLAVPCVEGGETIPGLEARMPDFSIDYSVLHDVETRMHKLAEEAGSGGAGGVFRELGEGDSGDRRAVLGNAGLSTAFATFYRMSARRTGEAEDGLKELASVFKSVADTFFDADSQLASGAGVMGASIGLDQWRDQDAAYDAWAADRAEWDAYLEKIGAADYFEANPDASIGEVCSADDAPGWCQTWMDDNDAPSDPGEAPPKPSEEPPTSYTYEDENGTIDVQLELNENHEVMKETSTITTTNGQSYTSVTEYDSPPRIVGIGEEEYDVRDYTMTTTFADGTVSTTTVVINDDGSGTMTEVNGEETRVSHRSGPEADWEPETPEEE